MNTLFLVYDKEYAYFPFITTPNLRIDTLWKNRTMARHPLVRISRKLNWLLEGCAGLALGDWSRSGERYDLIVVFDAVYEPMIGKYLRKKYPEAKKFIYMWDGKNRARLSGRQLFPVLSFNQDDKKNHMIFQPPFYTTIQQNNPREPVRYDVFYCGRIKNRKEEITEIYNRFQTYHLSTKFHIVTDDSRQQESLPCTEQELTYQEVIGFLLNSRAVLNIVDKKEYGTITLRLLEALFYGKKYITNDPRITETELYHPDYVYVITMSRDEEEEKKQLVRFLRKEVDFYPKERLNQFSIEAFLHTLEDLDKMKV